MTPITLDPAVLDLARRAGEHLTRRDDGATLRFSADLETVHEVTHSDGAYHVRVISRGDRQDPIVSSTEVTQIEKYLTYVFGRTVRTDLGLPQLSTLGEELPEGITLEERPGFRYHLRWNDGGATHEVVFSQRTVARIFAGYARAGRSEIEASLLAPDGRPVFSVRSDDDGDSRTPWYRRGWAT